MACMLGHPQSKAFIEHMKRRNDEAGLSADVPGKIELKDQPEEKETETTEE